MIINMEWEKRYKFLLAGHIVGFSIGVMMIIFTSSNFIVGSENITGNDLIAFPAGDPIATTLSFSIIFMLVGLVVEVVVGFCLLLSDFELIEDEGILEMLVSLQVYISIFLIVVTFVILVCLRFMVNGLNRGQEASNMLGIGGVINFVFAIVLFFLSLAVKYSDKINFDNFD